MIASLVGGPLDGETLEVPDGWTALNLVGKPAAGWMISRAESAALDRWKAAKLGVTYRDTGAATAEGWRVFACEPPEPT